MLKEVFEKHGHVDNEVIVTVVDKLKSEQLQLYAKRRAVSIYLRPVQDEIKRKQRK